MSTRTRMLLADEALPEARIRNADASRGRDCSRGRAIADLYRLERRAEA